MSRYPVWYTSPLLLAVFALTLTIGLVKAAPDYYKSVNAANAKQNRCDQVATSGTRCAGHLVKPGWQARTDNEALTGAQVDAHEQIATELHAIHPDGIDPQPGIFIPRATGDVLKIGLYIQSVPDNRRIVLQDFSAESNERAQGLVVARITADMPSPNGVVTRQDRIYGAGPVQGRRREPYFYVISTGFDDKNKQPKHDAFRVSEWQVWAIDTINLAGKDRVVAVRVRTVSNAPPTLKSGAYRVCAISHPDATVKYATFDDCLPALQYLQILADNESLRAMTQGQSLVTALLLWNAKRSPGVKTLTTPLTRLTISAVLDAFLANRIVLKTANERAVLLRVARDAFESPGWIPCGVGCCVADVN